MEIGSTAFRPEDTDIHPWTCCYSCGAGLLLHFDFATLRDIAAIPYFGGGHNPAQPRDRAAAPGREA